MENKKGKIVPVNDDEKTSRTNGTNNIVNNYKIFNGKVITIKNTFFNRNENKAIIPQESKVILFIGETGSGKSTTLNTFKNYLENIKYNDNYRWKLVDESKHYRKLSQSQTDHLKLYITNGYTFIDTPGFNDTDGMYKDNQTMDDIKRLIDKKLDYIDGICFVIKNSDNRLKESMKYVIDNVLGLFAKDILNNIYIIVTHCDSLNNTLPFIVADHDILSQINPKKRVIYLNNSPYIDPPVLKNPGIFGIYK